MEPIFTADDFQDIYNADHAARIANLKMQQVLCGHKNLICPYTAEDGHIYSKCATCELKFKATAWEAAR